MFVYNIYQIDHDKIMAELTALSAQIQALKAQSDSNAQVLQGLPALITTEASEVNTKVAELQALIDQLQSSGGSLDQAEIDSLVSDLQAINDSSVATGQGLAAIAASISEIVPGSTSAPVDPTPVDPSVPVVPVDPSVPPVEPAPFDPNQI